MLPPAPARFSTTNGCPRESCSRVASARPTMSGVEPGGKVTTTRTGFEGYACAQASKGAASTAARRLFISDPLRSSAARLPHHEAPLYDRHDAVERQRECRQHQDTGEHGVDVEHAFGLQDQVADAFRRAEVLPDH